MNDEETVALIAGGHTFGKAMARSMREYVGAEPEGAEHRKQGFGWKNSFDSASAHNAWTSGLEGA